jgi:hypothetical protein
MNKEASMDKLYILWTNADIITSRHMVFMYAGNAKRNGWWRDVTIIIWGTSAELLKNNAQMCEDIAELMSHGVEVIACKACADRLGATQTLTNLGIEVEYLGTYLTDVIKDPAKSLITI